ncbi:hypothetical protein EJF36_10510 [Bacillus sp. HMF5848]|uniref:hypothetical protein n=1 Tax=Bacillus sp. HMF5848 TaxID=2495421 RepID=UPI000F77C524|nr:hypothetical protein [Bacillus sp. HMF5848]RSK27278.1 hypothetical protein EJF36_10510 [Bacillus sp. HMF5848]
MNKETPKYKVGDIVVVTQHGTVGTVTDVKWLDGIYVYEVNNSHGLYFEHQVKLLQDYNHNYHYLENVTIPFKFYLGDLVMVEGYEEDLFTVIGIRTEIWRSKDDTWEEVIFELIRITDGEWLEATEDELSLIAEQKNEQSEYLQQITLLFTVRNITSLREKVDNMNGSRKREQEILRQKAERQEIIDGLLDVYNDYKFLYETFGGDYYKDTMGLVMEHLQKLTNMHYNNKN